MPLEIRELHVKVSVGDPAPEGGASGEGAGTGAVDDALIRHLVDKVLEILKERTER